MHLVYILKSEKDGTFYVGYTSDIDERLKQHNSASNKGWTNRKKPWRLVYTESFKSRKESMTREREIKKLGTKYRRKLIGDVV